MAAQVSAVALSSGASADAKYKEGVAVFTLSKGGAMAEAAGVDDRMIRQQVALINSMTKRERANPDLLQASRDRFLPRGDRWGSTYALHNLGLVLSRLGDYHGAVAVFQQSLRACQQVGDRGGEAFSLHQLGLVLGLREEHGLSIRYLADALRVALEINDDEGAVWHLYEMAVALNRMGRNDEAVEILAHLLQTLGPVSYTHLTLPTNSPV